MDPPPIPLKPSGAAHRAIHLDAVEEALSKPARRAPGRPRRQLRDFAMRQLKRAEKLQRTLLREVKEKRASGQPLDATLIQAVQACKAISDTMMNAIEQIRRSDKAEKEKMGDLTEADLEQVFTSQLSRIAPKLDDDAKRLMLTIWFGDEVADVLLKPREVTP